MVHAFIKEYYPDISAILNLLTLGALVWYACLTMSIARAAVSQSEDMETPFLALISNRDGEGNLIGYALRNEGKGPAINITYRGYRDGLTHLRRGKPLGPGSQRNMSSFGPADLKEKGCFIVQYESLSGNGFITCVTRTGVDDYNVEFIPQRKDLRLFQNLKLQ